jgi:hypothetical protein
VSVDTIPKRAADTDLEQLTAEFPGWHAWKSSAGRCWATRVGRNARYGRDDRRPMTIDADDTAALREQLARVRGQSAALGAGGRRVLRSGVTAAQEVLALALAGISA